MRVALEGLIGAGKSTLLSLVEKQGVPTAQEAVDVWGTLLTRFYADPERWAFTLQMQILLTQGQMAATGVAERSPHSALHVFAREKLDGEEWRLLEQWTERQGWTPGAVVFLKADPDLCLRRVRLRERPGEESITLEYLEELDRKYADYLTLCQSQGIPVHVLSHDDPELQGVLRSLAASP